MKKSRKIRKNRKKSKKRSRKFGYSHDGGPKIYNAREHDGILLANNAFNWMGSPLQRSLMAGSG